MLTLPLRYFDSIAEQSSAGAGYDLLQGSDVRPRIGGKRSNRKRRRTKKRYMKRVKGGFIPSIMEPFAIACGKYMAPLAGLSAYKLIHNPSKKYMKRKNRKTKRVTRK
jgi:hypothetical protein